MTMSLPIVQEANDLVNRSPLALLVAMLLDQQVPFEKAFVGPYELTLRLGHEPDADELAGFDPEALAEVFSERPAIHRFPKAMAARVQELCRILVAQYHGDAEAVWREATDGKDLLKRVSGLPGFGDQKSKIFVAMLGKRFDVRPDGWREAAGHYGEEGSHRSIADIVDEDSLREVRDYKKQMKAKAKA